MAVAPSAGQDRCARRRIDLKLNAPVREKDDKRYPATRRETR
jgi:hypothetical protein